MTDIPLNTRIEWTKEDRAHGKCPVPEGSNLSVYLSNGFCNHNTVPEDWDWSEDIVPQVIAYMVHSIPQQPREFWVFTNGHGDKCVSETWRENAIHVREVLE